MHSVVCVQVAVVACLFGLAASAHDLSASYPFRATLNTEERGGLYELYWRFDNEAQTIDFAVRVQTTGWVGFGLSPNGQMPNSDVVIGWVENSEAFLQVSGHKRVFCACYRGGCIGARSYLHCISY